MLSHKINWARLSAKYERLAAEFAHDADRLRFAGIAPAADQVRDLAERAKEMAATFAPVRSR